MVNTTFYVDLISTSVVSTCPAKYSAPMSVATGTAEILALGGLGFGMETPGGNQNGLLSANDRAAGCSWLFP